MLRSAAAVLWFLAPICAFSQTQPAPAFEVADVKVNPSGEPRMSVDFLPGGRLSMVNVPMRVLVMFAYHLRADAISGAPSWFASDRFDVVAKAPGQAAPDDLRRMLQTLLAERFHLVIHKDRKPMPAYALIVGKSGPKLQASAAAAPATQRCAPGEASPGRKHMDCHVSTANLADWLQEMATADFPVPVVDQTGLTGVFDFQLEWAPSTRSAAPPSGDAAPLEPAGPSIFDAVETLGLKLESRKLPLPVVVIDSVDRKPAEN